MLFNDLNYTTCKAYVRNVMPQANCWLAKKQRGISGEEEKKKSLKIFNPSLILSVWLRTVKRVLDHEMTLAIIDTIAISLSYEDDTYYFILLYKVNSPIYYVPLV